MGRRRKDPKPGDSGRYEELTRGRFALGGIGAGPLQLTCHREGQPAVATDWVLVG